MAEARFDPPRNKEFQRNEALENLLQKLNDLLVPLQKEIATKFVEPEYPVLLIVGSGRSGTTQLLQWLANTGSFCYPTNLLSRFYGAPYIGALVQQMLTNPKFNFRNEFPEFTQPVSFKSDLGKTEGTLSPNEFWYFWRRFFSYGEIQQLDEASLSTINRARFVAELASMQSVFQMPLAMKAMIINWNIPFVASLSQKFLFLFIRRDPFYNAQSLLESRKKFFGNIDHWYSFKPPEYEQLKTMNAYEQVAGQIYFTNKAVEDGLKQIGPSRAMLINYEELCAGPLHVYMELAGIMAAHGSRLGEYQGPSEFKSTNRMRVGKQEADRILESLRKFYGSDYKLRES